MGLRGVTRENNHGFEGFTRVCKGGSRERKIMGLRGVTRENNHGFEGFTRVCKGGS